jgi:predicted signal transduction protein with EAL and GGDEF domain
MRNTAHPPAEQGLSRISPPREDADGQRATNHRMQRPASLRTRLHVLIGLMALAGFVGSAVLQITFQRDLIASELASQNRNAATLLAVVLGHVDSDAASLKEAVDMLAASGRFQHIVVRSNGRNLASYEATAHPSAPAWFVSMIGVSTAPALATLRHGNHPTATVSVAADPGAALAHLWHGVLALALWFAAGGLIAGAVAGSVLRRLLRPLGDPVAPPLTPPAVLELVPLVETINTLAQDVEQRSATEGERLAHLDHLATHDELTGLANRSRFLAALDAHLAQAGDAGRKRGAMAMVRVTGMLELNRSLGRHTTDRILVDIGSRLRGIAGHGKGRLAGRLNGSDFVVLAPDLKRTRTLVDDISQALAALQGVHGEGLLRRLALGGAEISPGDSRARLLARLDGALAASEHTGWGDARIVDSDSILPTRSDLGGWREALLEALYHDHVRIDPVPVMTREHTLMYREARSRVLIDDLWYGDEAFAAWAERLVLTQRLDLKVVGLALDRIEHDPTPLGVHLSPSSMRDAAFVEALRTELASRPQAASQLWIELPEQGVVRDLPAFRALCVATRGFGCRIGIEHAGREFGQLGGLHDVGLDHIKIDAGLIENISSNPDKQDFIVRICELGHAIGLLVIAEGVDHSDDLDALLSLQIDGFTGSVVPLPEDEP